MLYLFKTAKSSKFIADLVKCLIGIDVSFWLLKQNFDKREMSIK